MINKKKTTSIAEATSAAIEVEPVLKPRALIYLIKDTSTEVVHKDKASEKKKNKKEKVRKKNKEKRSEQDSPAANPPTSETIKSIHRNPIDSVSEPHTSTASTIFSKKYMGNRQEQTVIAHRQYQ